MLFYNINPSNNLYNRTHLIILSITPRLLKCLIFKLQRHSAIVQLSYILLYTLSSTNNIKFIYHQFPIKFIFIIIINKTQSQSLSCISLLLNLKVFNYSQLYIILNHITYPNNIYIVIFNTKSTWKGRIKNIVYLEVLQRLIK